MIIFSVDKTKLEKGNQIAGISRNGLGSRKTGAYYGITMALTKKSANMVKLTLTATERLNLRDHIANDDIRTAMKAVDVIGYIARQK